MVGNFFAESASTLAAELENRARDNKETDLSLTTVQLSTEINLLISEFKQRTDGNL